MLNKQQLLILLRAVMARISTMIESFK